MSIQNDFSERKIQNMKWVFDKDKKITNIVLKFFFFFFNITPFFKLIYMT